MDNVWARFFSHFLRERSFKRFFHLLLLSFVTDGLFTTLVYSPRRGRFVNSAFPNKKNLAQKRSLFMTNKFESKCLQKFYISSKHEKECYMTTTSYLEEPNRYFCQHFMRRTTQQTFSAINLASQQKTTALLFFSGKEVALRRVLTKNSKWIERLGRAGFQR